MKIDEITRVWVLSFFCMGLGGMQAIANPLFGTAGLYGGAADSSYMGTGTVTYFTSDPGGDHYFQAGIPFSASASGSAGPASGSVAISATESNGNVALHGTAAASGAFSPGLADQAVAGFDLYSFDTFTIGGPSDTRVSFAYSINLAGTASPTGPPASYDADAYGGLELMMNLDYGNSWGSFLANSQCQNAVPYLGNPESSKDCGEIAAAYLASGGFGYSKQTGILTVESGSTIELGLDLWARTSSSEAGYPASYYSAVFDAGDTGFFTLTPITPGASFTTASGLTYQNDPDDIQTQFPAPEPATGTMMLAGFFGLGAMVRRRKRPGFLRIHNPFG